MNIVVLIKQVPDLVEELEIDSSGTGLDREWLKFKVNEFDEHALEEALLLKDEHGGTVTAMALDGDDIDKALYAAAAKGADRVVKVTGGGDAPSNHEAAKLMANAIGGMDYDIICTGVQSVEDRDGQLGVILARYLDVPQISVVTSVAVTGDKLTIQKEYGGGTVAEFETSMPVVLGIQAAREAPRYVPVAKVRRAMKGTDLEEVSAGDANVNTGSHVNKMFKPEIAGGAEMISGSDDEMASRLAEIIKG